MKIKIYCIKKVVREKELGVEPEEAVELLRHEGFGELESVQVGFLTDYMIDAPTIDSRGYEEVIIQINDL